MHLGKRLRDDMPFEYFRFGNAEAVLHRARQRSHNAPRQSCLKRRCWPPQNCAQMRRAGKHAVAHIESAGDYRQHHVGPVARGFDSLLEPVACIGESLIVESHYFPSHFIRSVQAPPPANASSAPILFFNLVSGSERTAPRRLFTTVQQLRAVARSPLRAARPIMLQ